MARLRLGFYVSHLGANPHNHDAENIYHDVMTKFIGLLNDPLSHRGHHLFEHIHVRLWD